MRQTNSKEIMQVLSMVLNEGDGTVSEGEQAFNGMYASTNNILAAALEKSIYPGSPNLLTGLEGEMDKAELLLTCPEFIGKPVIGIAGQNRAIYQHFVTTILGDTSNSSGILWNTNIPMLIAPANASRTQHAIFGINHRNIRLPLQFGDYRILVQEVYKKKVDIRQIIQCFITYKKLKTNHITYVLFPEHVQGNTAFMTSILPYIDRMVLHASQDYNWIRLYHRYASRVPMDIFSSEAFFDEARKELTAIPHRSDVLWYLSDSFPEYCAQRDKTCDNFHVADAIHEKILDVDSWYHKVISKKSTRIPGLATESIKSVQGDVKKQIQKLRKRTIADMDHAAQTYNEYIKAKEALLKAAITLEKCFYRMGQVEEPFDNTSMAQQTMLKIFYGLLDCEQYAAAKDYLQRLKGIGYPYPEALECVLYKMKHADFSESKLTRVRQMPCEHWEIAKACVYLSEELGLKTEELKKVAAFISNPTTGKEYFYLAKRNATKDVRKAVGYYMKALELDYKKAGSEVLKLTEKNPELRINVNELAENLVAEADYTVGTSSLSSRYKKGIVYLKMAASQGHMPAIRKLAEILFDKCKTISWQKVSESDNQQSIFNVIGLYEYLMQHDKKSSDYKEKIGLMYCKLQDWGRALECLKGCKTPQAQYECGKMYKYGNGTSKDLDKAKACFEFAMKSGYKDAATQFGKIKNWQSNRTTSSGSYSSSRSYSSSSSSSYSSSGWCFITTAACIALTSDKDCDELNVLRKFRDERIDDGGEGTELVREYYRIGPTIVEKIDSSWNPIAIYRELWEDYIQPSYTLINAEKWDEAKSTYIRMVRALCMLFGVKVQERIMEKYEFLPIYPAQ